MTNKNDIDKLFKKGMYNQQPDFNMEAWQKMEALLDKENQKKTPWFFNTFLGLSILLVAGSGIYFFNSTPNSNKKSQTTNLESQSNSSNLSNFKTEINLPKKKNTSEVTNTTINNNKEQSNYLINEQKNSSENNSQEEKSFRKKENSHQNNIVNQSILKTKLTEKRAIKTPNKNELATYKTKAFVNNISSNFIQNISVNTSNKNNFNSKLVNLFNPINKTNLGFSLFKEQSNEEQLAIENTSINEQLYASNTITIPPFNKDEKSISLMPFKNAIPILEEKQKEVLAKSKEKEQKNKATRQWLNFLRKINLGVIVGGGISRGYLNTAVSRGGFSFTPLAGLRASLLINESVSFDINVLYNSQSSLSSTLSVVGKNGQTTINNFKSLHYLSIPLYINYKTARGGVLVGLRFSKLLTVKNQQIKDRIENGNIVQQTNTVWGNNSNFSSSDVSISIGYQHLVTERLSVGSRLNYGLFDVTDNTAFRNSVSDYNLDLQFTLDYTIFKY